jgi:hypothetical protein
MSRKARLSETRFRPDTGIDLDAIAERCDELNSGVELEEMNFNDVPKPKQNPSRSRVANFS